METFVCRVLTQGTQHDTVLELDTTNLQWLEQLGNRLVVRLGVNRRSCWRPLRGTVVWNTLGSHIVDVLLASLLSLDFLLWSCALLGCGILDAVVGVGPLGPNQ
jgi:hypothetical protein